jgi:hypothetical protein
MSLLREVAGCRAAKAPSLCGAHGHTPPNPTDSMPPCFPQCLLLPVPSLRPPCCHPCCFESCSGWTCQHMVVPQHPSPIVHHCKMLDLPMHHNSAGICCANGVATGRKEEEQKREARRQEERQREGTCWVPVKDHGGCTSMSVRPWGRLSDAEQRGCPAAAPWLPSSRPAGPA